MYILPVVSILQKDSSPFFGIYVTFHNFSLVFLFIFTIYYYNIFHSFWQFYSCQQRTKWTCLHVRLAVLCAGGTRLAPTEVERRPATKSPPGRNALGRRGVMSLKRPNPGGESCKAGFFFKILLPLWLLIYLKYYTIGDLLLK